ncbi:MAG: hypothetical protein CO095_06640 [Armatimonadetes bacterium CG_4_9_14_3_um_filter_58_7]|nr:MAG: hypothetical protein CO095_06640 [Armatimonadetes bacterium CG_4_9_14_3_um_filter_58_7]
MQQAHGQQPRRADHFLLNWVDVGTETISEGGQVRHLHAKLVRAEPPRPPLAQRDHLRMVRAVSPLALQFHVSKRDGARIHARMGQDKRLLAALHKLRADHHEELAKAQQW